MMDARRLREAETHAKAPNGPPPLRAKRFRLKQVEDDYLRCVAWDGEEETQPVVFVAKPYELRKTPFDGVEVGGVFYTYASSIERNASEGVASETQVIVPAYLIDGEILAIAPVAGGTGVAVDDSPVVWMDLNAGARAWAAQPEDAP